MSRFLYIAYCTVLSSPLLLMFVAWVFPSDGGFGYLLTHGLLWEYGLNSILIALFCGVITLVIGTGTAWATSVLHFPGRKILNWFLVLPLAMPGYIAAMVYAYLLEGAGPVQTQLRALTGWQFGEYWFPEIRSVGGAIFILSVTLYPYVYLLAKAAFAMQSRQLWESGQLLGYLPTELFMRLMLPMARPMLAVGAALVMMEALADYGVVSLFGVPAFTTGIYRAWQGLYDPIAAGQMASMLLLIVLVIFWLERLQRGKASYSNSTALYHPLSRLKVRHGRWISLICALPVIFGFLLPFAVILCWAFSRLEMFAGRQTWMAVEHSLIVAGLVAAIAGVLGLCMAYYLRRDGSASARMATRIASMGYAVPGAVIAVGILWSFLLIERHVFAGNVLFTGTILGVVWACTFRFLTVSFNAAESGLQCISPTMDQVASTLGTGNMGILTRIHLPILRSGILAGMIMVFVDTLKELPATLLLRPFNFDTLAIRTYELAGDELLQRAAPTALMLVVVSLFPVWYVTRKLTRTQEEAGTV